MKKINIKQRKVHQKIKNLNLLYQYAKDSKEEFDSILNEIASENKTVAILTPLKDRKKAAEKVKLEYKGDASYILDIIRGAIIAQRLRDINSILKSIKKRFKIVRIIDRINNPTVLGYRDIVINIELNSGLIAEIQIWLKELAHIKRYTGHIIYDLFKKIDHKKEEEKRELYSWEKHILEEVVKIGRYNAERAWERQLSIEKGENLNKIIFVVTGNKEKVDEVKKIVPNIKWINIENIKEIQ